MFGALLVATDPHEVVEYLDPFAFTPLGIDSEGR
jgi:hypothetical protein